jgi:hypothetical protein
MNLRPLHSLNLRAASLALIAIVCASATARAQSSADADPAAVALGPETVTRFKLGAKVVASRGAVRDVRILLAAPLECPEQTVRLVEEDVSRQVEELKFRENIPGVRQMLIAIPSLQAGAEAHAYVTFEVRTRTQTPPTESAQLRIPRRVPRELRAYLAASPFIEVGDRRIRDAATEALAALDPPPTDDEAWRQVEAIYDHALAKVSYQLGDDKPAVKALADGVGDCQAISAVFVAMCRTLKVPARMVWVDGHQYAEFYLENAAGVGHWYPIESAGTRSFGGMPLARVILQKGDNFRVPERKGERLRYASDYAAFNARPDAQPTVTYVREKLPAGE